MVSMEGSFTLTKLACAFVFIVLVALAALVTGSADVGSAWVNIVQLIIKCLKLVMVLIKGKR